MNNFIILCLFLSFSCSSVTEPKKEESTQELVGDEEEINFSEYVIRQGDTFMWIAYKIYGDHTRWKELSSLNPDMPPRQLIVGDILSYEAPPTPFEWRNDGFEYRIKKGDTLGLISKKIYGTPSFWMNLYENNLPMIRDPNLIFTNFILFYKQKSSMAQN